MVFHFCLITFVNLLDASPQIQTVAPYPPLVTGRVFECLMSLEHMDEQTEQYLGHAQLPRFIASRRYLPQPAFHLQARDFVLCLLKALGNFFVYGVVEDK